MTFYSDMKVVADELLTEFGTTIEIITYDGTVLSTVVGIKSPVDITNVPQTVIQSSSATLYFTHTGVDPTLQHFIRMDGQEYVITHVEPVRPTNETVMWKVYVGNGG